MILSDWRLRSHCACGKSSRRNSSITWTMSPGRSRTVRIALAFGGQALNRDARTRIANAGPGARRRRNRRATGTVGDQARVDALSMFLFFAPVALFGLPVFLVVPAGMSFWRLWSRARAIRRAVLESAAVD